ncbi:hypothetical protein TNCV_4502051 [Trichonephila clavipes]|nr:hypothetical protein TNCV_4502051 [Trichonephila clavipes]
MATSTNKTAAFGVKLIHKCMSKHRYIQKNRVFGAFYGLVESFFKNDEGHNVTVNGDRYRAMITNFFIPELNNHDDVKIQNDEVHFWLNGYVNKQNCRIWSEANPQVYVETPLHPEKLIVWCALWAGGILLQKR